MVLSNVVSITYLFDLQLLAETHSLFGLDLGLVSSQAQAHANGGVVGIQNSIVVWSALIG